MKPDQFIKLVENDNFGGKKAPPFGSKEKKDGDGDCCGTCGCDPCECDKSGDCEDEGSGKPWE